jgi:shikimate dehydrogenase
MSELAFVGLTTASSLVHEAMPLWRPIIGAPISLAGIDIAVGADHSTYTQALDDLRSNPNAVGAVVTTHKIALFRAAATRFAYLDSLALACREINAIRCTEDGLHGWARDPLSVGRVVDRIWPEDPGHVVCLGSGGTGVALARHLLTTRSAVRFECADTDRAAIDHLVHVVGRRVDVHVGDGPWDQLVTEAPRGSLIVNATGMGKDRPGSPVTDGVVFPDGAVVWELNYRGRREFLDQALRDSSRAERQVHDGWQLFCHGWAAALDAVLDLADDGSLGDRFANAASQLRPRMG